MIVDMCSVKTSLCWILVLNDTRAAPSRFGSTPNNVSMFESQRTSGATIRIAESAYASVGNEKLTVPGATPPCLNDQPIRKLDPPTRSNMQAGLIASETDLYVVDVAQLERAYAHASEAVLLTDDQHRLIWGNSVYHALVAMVDASHFMGHRPTPISLSLYRFRAPSGAECRYDPFPTINMVVDIHSPARVYAGWCCWEDVRVADGWM